MAVVNISAGLNGFTAGGTSIIGGTGTVTKIFPALVFPNAGLNSVTVSTPGPCSLPVPANGQFEGRRFIVKAGGRIFIHGTSPTLNWFMYNGTSMTAANDGTALVTTASALSGLTTNKTYPWTWETVFQGDSTSGILQAVSSVLWVNNATGGTITLTGIASGVNFLANGPTGLVPSGYAVANAMNLIIGIQFTVSDALNAGYMNQFECEA